MLMDQKISLLGRLKFDDGEKLERQIGFRIRRPVCQPMSEEEIFLGFLGFCSSGG